MPWRDALIKNFGPGFLGGIRFGEYVVLLRENRFAIAPSCWFRSLAIAAQSLQVGAAAQLEEWQYGKQVRDTLIEPPLFVLGHWRSGTTHLHNLLTLDTRFGFPNNYQCLFPNAFLTLERSQSPAIGFFLPQRRPMDNIEWTMQSPQEDEFALAMLCGLSPYIGWVFPRNQSLYDRYLTFEGVPEPTVNRWRNALHLLLQKLSWKIRKPLILKSPPHTARIRLLLEMFPQAKFVHIHRHPYAVFPSTKRTLVTTSPPYHRLQHFAPEFDLDDWILRQYRSMYDAFFAQRELIPAGQYHELGFEDLERDPLGELRRLYEALALPDFAQVEPKLDGYVASLGNYHKNQYPVLSDDLRARIAERWGRNFDAWNYAR